MSFDFIKGGDYLKSPAVVETSWCDYEYWPNGVGTFSTIDFADKVYLQKTDGTWLKAKDRYSTNCIGLVDTMDVLAMIAQADVVYD